MTYDRTRTYSPRRRPPDRTPEQRKQAARRKTRRYRKPTHAEVLRMRKRALLLLYAVLGLEIVTALLTSPVLAVRRQTIRGLGPLSPVESAAVLNAAKLAKGTNLLRVPVGPLSRRIAALPFVDSVEVGRRIPPAISVVVHPRKTVINAVLNGVTYEVDHAGVPIRLTPTERLSQFPTVVIDYNQPVKLGARLRNGMVTAAIDLLPKLREACSVQVAKIEVDQTDSICLNMMDGLRILLGQTDSLDVKLSEIHRIYKHEPTIASRLSTVNLTSPAYPACELKNPPANAQTGLPAGVSPSGTVEVGDKGSAAPSRRAADTTVDHD
jgi:cell division protein FtsQ